MDFRDGSEIAPKSLETLSKKDDSLYRSHPLKASAASEKSEGGGEFTPR